jgi:methylenetetrahydrofolate dehydrogenase (NADP+) / methenyltetrahydrofolate cyclohydrolase
MARILDGKQMAQAVTAELQPQVAAFQGEKGRVPGLAAVLVGDNPASEIYIRNKRRACAEAGITSSLHELPFSTSQRELLDLIRQLNAAPEVDGILVQLPLPPQIAEEAVIETIAPTKDVDCFSPENLGLLVAGKPRFLPCTPHAVWQILQRGNVPLDGRHVVILGRSNIVGKPLSLLLTEGLAAGAGGLPGNIVSKPLSLLLMQKHPHANATVTVCHSRSRQLADLTRQADVLVAAMGQAELVTGDMVKSGAVVIDVGINRTATGKLVGDVHRESVEGKVEALTPVPGGVGPMTIAMLLLNTLSAAQLRGS